MAHNHDHDAESNIPFQEKMAKLLAHWIKHNDDHAESYREWAGRMTENDMAVPASFLNEAAEMTLEISKKFEAARRALDLSSDDITD